LEMKRADGSSDR